MIGKARDTIRAIGKALRGATAVPDELAALRKAVEDGGSRSEATIAELLAGLQIAVAAASGNAAAALGKASHVHNDTNAILTRLALVEQRLDRLHQMLERGERLRWLTGRAEAVARAAILAGDQVTGDPVPPVASPAPVDLAEQFRALEAAAPLNFAAWLDRYRRAEAEYACRLPTSLSTTDHAEAGYFRAFVCIHARARVLDIGVGQLAKPVYLADIPEHRLAGLDPLPPFAPHPFPFAQGVAEFIPWPAASFETLVVATSIDHVYLLDRALAEMRRVLAPGGKLLIWTGIFADTPAYHPYSGRIEPPDEYHLFHPGETWFLAELLRHFRLVERYVVNDVGYSNCFLALERD